jgi:hypothetical protein
MPLTFLEQINEPFLGLIFSKMNQYQKNEIFIKLMSNQNKINEQIKRL